MRFTTQVSSLDADSMYFEYPAGNLIELIGRRHRDLFGKLICEAFFDVSEVAITTEKMQQVGDELQDFALPLHHGTEIDANVLNSLRKGDHLI